VIEGMGLRGEAFSSTRRTYQEVEVDQELINKLRLREGDEDIEIEEDPVESNDVEEIDHGEDSNGDRGIESNDNQDKCKLTGPRSRRTQGYHRRLMEREPLCIPCNDNGDTKEVELWRLRSVWPAKKPEELEEEKDNLPEYMFDKEGNPVYLHLHPEFVREEIVPGEKNRYYATICSYCKKSLDGKKSPWRSIVSGVDFGDGNRIGLEPLTERERQMVSKVRHFLLVVKIESNTADGRVIERGQSAVKGCGIYFNHDSPRVVSDLLSEDSMNGDVSLQFVGPEGEYDALVKKVMGSSNIEGRSWIIYQWLKVLQEVNCHYQYDDKLPEFEEVKAKIKAANEALVTDAEFVNDDSVVRETEIAKDDARHIRTHGGVGNDVDDMEVEELVGGNVDFPMRCSYITHTKAGSGKDADRDYLESAAEALGVDAKEFATTLSRREGTPLNEYEHGDGILAKACPDVCIFGTAYNSSRPNLTTYQTEHLIMQYTTNAACNRQLLCQLFESKRRHGVITNMHAKASTNPKEFEKFADEFSTSEFQEKLKAAVRNPDGADAKYVLNKVTPLLTFAGRKSAFGALERNQSAGEMLALGRRYGCAPAFLTFGIDDINNPNAIRLALRSSSNEDFPAVVSSASRVELDRGIPLEDEHAGVVHIPRGYTERLKHMNDNPIGAALAYKQVVHDIMEILIGIKPSMYGEHGEKSTKPKIRKGLVGQPRAFFGKNETTHSGSLHFHVIIWAGLSPWFIEFASDIPQLCKLISEMLESQYCAELDRHVHVKDLVHMNIKTVKGLKKIREKRLRDLKQGRISADHNDMESPISGEFCYLMLIVYTIIIVSNQNIVRHCHLDESIDDIMESSSSIGGVPDASDDDVSFAAPPKIHRLLSVDSEKGDSEENSSPGAFAEYGNKLLKSRCIDGCGVDDHCTQANTDQTSQKYPGINVVTPTKPIISSRDLKRKGGKSIGDASQNVFSSRPKPRAMELPPDPEINDGDFKTFVGVTICHCGIHMHTFTCKKPPKGWHGCRLCFPKALSNGTRPIELASSIQPDGTTQWDELDPHVTEYEIEEPRGYTRKVKQDCVEAWDPIRDPERYTTKEVVYPLQSDSSRTVIWELNRPKLKELDPLSEGMTKEDIISRLCEEMLSDENKGNRESIRSSVFMDASSRLAMEQIDLHCFDKNDENNLFFTLLLGLIESSRLKAGEKSVQCMRRELMHHLSKKLHNYKFDESDTSTVAQYIESRMDVEHVTEDTIEQYIQLMENVTGDDCFEGGELEIRLFSEMGKVNVAIYEEVVPNEGEDGEEVDGVSSSNSNKQVSYKRVEFFGTDENDRTTIHLRRERNNGGSNPRACQGTEVRPPKYHYTLITSKLKGVMDSLQAFNLHDLKVLYGLVSKYLPERNGKVVEFNPVLASLLGCNSNLLYLGSMEQSKAALFYIGPYINKDGVKITDALPILMKAQEDTIKYPSIADDRNTAKRHAQHTLTRALNKLNGLMEISDTQIGASLLQMNASLCSDSFVVCDTTAYEKFIDAELRRTKESNVIHGVDTSGGLEEEMENIIGFENINTELQNMFYHEGGDGEDTGDVDGSGTIGARHNNSTENIIGEDEGESVMNEDGNSRINNRKNYITQSQTEEDDHSRNDEDGEDFACVNASFGSAPFYKTNDGTKQPISYAALYRHRGKALKDLSRYEYCACVKVVESKDDSSSSPNTSSGHGRSKSTAFPFGPGLGIENNYHQILRSKQLTPKFPRSPPPPPKVKPQHQEPDQFDEAGEYEDYVSKYEHELDNWRKKADKFAHFYLTMFRPEEELYERGQICRYKYNYEAFLEFYVRVRVAARGSKYHNDLLELIDSMVNSWRVDMEKREMLAAHRGRAKTMWSAEQKEANKAYFGGNLKPILDDDGMDYISDTVQELTSKEMTDARKHLGHSNAILSTLGRMTEASNGTTDSQGQSSSSASRPPNVVANVTTLPFNMDLDESKRQSKIEDTYIDDDNTSSTPNTFRTIPDLDTKVKDYIKAQDLSADKDIVINIAHEHFKAIRSGDALEDDYEAPNLLVCGKPGNGKSKIIESLDGIAEKMKVGEQMKNAFLGSAAINIRGTTLLKSWNIPVFSEGQRVTFRPWNEDSLQALKRRFGHNVDNICAVVIDEISTVQPYMLAYLNIRMQELFGNDKLFGGRMVILLGDFQQKPPTAGGKGNSLPGVVMKHIEEEGKPLTLKSAEKLGLAETGGYLFSKFRYIKLTSQHRSGDPKHMAVLNKMSETGIVNVKDLKNTYKTLSREDMESDDFRFATNIVTGNAERREINAWQAKRWAEHYGVNTVRWPRKREEASWKGRPRTEECVAHAMQNSCFWEYCIPGAMGYLNTYSINSVSGLANGTEIKYHSLSFEDKERRKQFNLKCAQAKPGDIISIDSPPTAINVELFPDFAWDSTSETAKKKRERKEWLRSGKGSITRGGRVVIPISLRDGGKIQSKKTYVPGCTRLDMHQYYYHDSSLMIKDWFPIEPAFSITVDKAQVSAESINFIVIAL